MGENIFLFVPNLIGYARIILALVSFYYMRSDYVIASACYIVSALLDAFDGHAARMLNQGTKFGAMLDQLTDRAASMCLLVVLAVFYPEYTFWFQLSMAIDIVAHWMHLHSCNMQGVANHKLIDPSQNALLHLYYTSRPLLFFMCAGNELFYSTIYLLYFTEGPMLPVLGIGMWRVLFWLCTPVAIVKSLISLVHLVVASINIARIDASDREKKK